MKYLKISLVVLLNLALTSVLGMSSIEAHGGGTHSAAPQGQSTALERGYRTGYSDGYNAGFGDVAAHASRDYQNKDEYQRADRSYNDVWGPIEDYRDGYQQGFEAGYSGGYDRRQFDSTIPSGLRRRGAIGAQIESSAPNNSAPNNSNSTNVPVNTAGNNPSAPVMNGSWSIPRDTILTLELLTPLSTDATQRGDRFQARVTAPNEYAGALVEGRVTQVKRAGKVKGVSELQLTFDQISTPDNRAVSLHAELVEVVPMGRDEGTEVDPEGGVKGRSTTKDDVSKVGAATGVGAIIGAIVGGGKGAAIGAVIGGSAGTGAVMSQRGKDIRLDRGQQIKIRTSTDTSAL
jgi:hypothetical protein